MVPVCIASPSSTCSCGIDQQCVCMCVCVCVFVCEQHLTCYKFDSGKTIFNPIHHCLSDSGKMSENWLFCLYNGIRGMNTGIEIQRKKKKKHYVMEIMTSGLIRRRGKS